MCEIYTAQLKHYENSLSLDVGTDVRICLYYLFLILFCEMFLFQEKHFIVKNIEFLLTTLYNLMQKKYMKANGFECKSLSKVNSQYLSLIKMSSSTRRTKYSSDLL